MINLNFLLKILFNQHNNTDMNWNNLEEINTLESIIKESESQPVLIFKHSTRCSISSSAKDRLERKWDNNQAKNIKPYYLDLLNHRDISNQIANAFGVEHQSPQAILIKNGKAVFNASHMSINFESITKSI